MPIINEDVPSDYQIIRTMIINEQYKLLVRKDMFDSH